ncbi:MAG TPA: protein kinase [Acidobacteriota bacterium]
MAFSRGTQLGPYKILSPIGAGGMGEVYRARDPRLDREVAVKVLPAQWVQDADRLRRFESEARAAGALSHPNVLAVYDLGTYQGCHYVVSELLEGETLQMRLQQGPLPPRKAIDVAAQIAQGLAAAHDKGIIHRDLKPSNLFITAEGRVKILDFGLAKRSPATPSGPDTPTRDPPTAAGTVLGTVGYMSPEQVRGGPADQRSDIFSLGAVLYEMLAGRRAFSDSSNVETMHAILRAEPPGLAQIDPSIPAALDRIVRRCLEKRPEERFQSARDFGFALEAVAAAAGPSGAPAGGGSKRSVAVLPFKDLARSAENAHLGVGLADATITELAQVKSLLVRPTAAILRYQDSPVDPAQAGRELGVDAVLDGSFQRAGPHLRVTVQLVGSADGTSLWGAKIHTSLEDLFRMQDEVSRKIATALQIELTPADQRRLARTSRLGGAAYELYIKGRVHLLRETLPDLRAAIESFQAAVNAEPNFALAWAALSDAYSRMAFDFEPETLWYGRAREMCDRALALDPALPEGRYLRGRLLWSPEGGFDHAGAMRELAAALAARPGLGEARVLLGMVLFHVGLVEEALGEFEAAAAIDPDNPHAHLHLASCRYHQRRFQQALELSEAAVRRAPAPWGYNLMTLCHIQLGHLDQAELTVDRLSRELPDRPAAQSLRGLIAVCRGDAEEARRQVALMAQTEKKGYGHYHHAQYDAACIFALLGEPRQAVEWLRQAARNGYPCHSFFARDRLLDRLRHDVGFQHLMDQLEAECDGYRQLYSELPTCP